MHNKTMLILLAGLAFSPVPKAAIYLKLDGIKGDVTVQGYTDWIELSSLSWGSGRAISMEAGNGSNREASRPSFSEVTVHKENDVSSAYLFHEAAVGTDRRAPAEIHITTLNSTGHAAAYLELLLTDPLLSQFSLSGGADQQPRETVSISYTKFEERVIRFDNGIPGPVNSAWYDLKTATAGLTDGGGSSANQAPTISKLPAQSTPEDIPKTVSFTVGDPDGAVISLSLSKSSSNTALLPLNRISFGGSGANRSATLSPAPNQYGSATVTVSVSDGSKSASTTFSLTVAPQNDAPILGAPSSIQLISGTPTALSGITVNDVDAGALPLSLAATVTQGTLQTNAAEGGVTVSGAGFSSVGLQGSVANLNAFLASPQSLMFHNYQGFSGMDQLTLTLNDDGNSGAGGAAQIQAVVKLRVFASLIEQWKNSHFGSDLENAALETSVWGDGADPDQDGLPNLLEYALGFIPNLADAGNGPQRSVADIEGSNYYTIEFERHPDPQVEMFVEVCSDLSDAGWSSDASEMRMVDSTPTNSMQRLTFQDQRSLETSTNRFYRIGAKRIP